MVDDDGVRLERWTCHGDGAFVSPVIERTVDFARDGGMALRQLTFLHDRLTGVLAEVSSCRPIDEPVGRVGVAAAADADWLSLWIEVPWQDTRARLAQASIVKDDLGCQVSPLRGRPGNRVVLEFPMHDLALRGEPMATAPVTAAKAMTGDR
jgi:hypothetical protein